MSARVRSTNLAQPQPDPGGAKRVSGIDKRPVPELELFIPGPNYGDGAGVRGDVIGDAKHHGGAQKAVYGFAREELDHWAAELGRDLPDGTFGENLTTEGIDLEALVINQPLHIGEVVLEVSVPRRPCRTFAGWLAQRGWVKMFAARGRCGSYFRVVTPGVVRPGDVIEPGPAPEHGITMAESFAAAMGDREQQQRLVAARCLPEMYHRRYVNDQG